MCTCRGPDSQDSRHPIREGRELVQVGCPGAALTTSSPKRSLGPKWGVHVVVCQKVAVPCHLHLDFYAPLFPHGVLAGCRHEVILNSYKTEGEGNHFYSHWGEISMCEAGPWKLPFVSKPEYRQLHAVQPNNDRKLGWSKICGRGGPDGRLAGSCPKATSLEVSTSQHGDKQLFLKNTSQVWSGVNRRLPPTCCPWRDREGTSVTLEASVHSPSICSERHSRTPNIGHLCGSVG